MGYTIRTDTFRYVEWYDWEQNTLVAQELYDHRQDSRETVNLATHPECIDLVTDLKQKLRVAFHLATDPGCH